MKLSKAIEVNKTLLTPDPQFSPELRRKAVKLLIEAGKRFDENRAAGYWFGSKLLPGETEE